MKLSLKNQLRLSLTLVDSPQTKYQKAKSRLIQRKVRNAKNNKRITPRPASAEPTFERKPFHAPGHKVLAVPEWFEGDGKDVDISIVVPCFKSQEYIREQIASWDLSSDGFKVEIVYVDDGCPFKTHEAIIDAWNQRRKELKAPVGKIVQNAKNGGFACACNVGASYSSGKYIVFLNADTTVTPNWLRPMYTALQDATIGLVGNLHLRKDGTIDSCGSEWDWKSSAFLHSGRHIFQKKKLDKPYTVATAPEGLLVPRDVEMVTGACMMMPKKLFDKIGGFDTEYRIGYWEDTELNMRVHSQRIPIRFVPDSVIVHKVGHTHSGAHGFMDQNRRLFHKRWVETKVIEAYLDGSRNEIKNIEIPSNSIVAYTAITGDYDDLKPQPHSAIKSTPFVAFLDRPLGKFEPTFWEVRPVHNEFKDPNRNAKIHKVMPHLFFPDKEYSLWLDGSCKIEFPFSIERLIQIYLSDTDFAVFRHPDRNCIYQEANVCLTRRLDDQETIRQQINRYTKEGYPSNNGLAECSILLRRHTPAVQKFNEAWWEEIKNGSRRDQISFNYVVRKTGLKIRYFPGDLRKINHLFKREGHKKRR
jgi:GT2 family glycosyltransferase